MYTVAVYDHDRMLCETLCHTCKNILQEYEVTARLIPCCSALELGRLFSEGNDIDLLILDLKLGKKGGIEFARELRRHDSTTGIILTDDDPSQLLNGYRVQPISFLIKPISRESLAEAIAVDLRNRRRNTRVIVRSGTRPIEVSTGDIFYLEIMDHLLTLHTKRKTISTRSTLTRLMNLLPSGDFCRCHNSFAVSLAHIINISRTEGVTLDCGVTLPIGRKYYDTFQQCFLRFLSRN